MRDLAQAHWDNEGIVKEVSWTIVLLSAIPENRKKMIQVWGWDRLEHFFRINDMETRINFVVTLGNLALDGKRITSL